MVIIKFGKPECVDEEMETLFSWYSLSAFFYKYTSFPSVSSCPKIS